MSNSALRLFVRYMSIFLYSYVGLYTVYVSIVYSIQHGDVCVMYENYNTDMGIHYSPNANTVYGYEPMGNPRGDSHTHGSSAFLTTALCRPSCGQ